MSVTSVAFTATASDANGDALTYAWDLGDGTTASGPTAQKVYDKAGTLHVVLKVTDSKGASTSVSTDVTVKSLSGFWNDPDQGYGIEITQTGTTFSGRTVFGVQNLTGALTGSVNTALQVQYRTSYFSGAFKDSLDGKLDAGFDVITGTLALTDGRVRFTFNMNMKRQ
jgi:PKD repeat protein